MVFLLPMQMYVTTVSHAEAITLAAFLAIAKYAGGAALTVGGATLLYNNWQSLADSDLVQELHNISMYGSTGLLAVSSLLYNSIFNFLANNHTNFLDDIPNSDLYPGNYIKIGIVEVPMSIVYNATSLIHRGGFPVIRKTYTSGTREWIRIESQVGFGPTVTHDTIHGNPLVETELTTNGFRTRVIYKDTSGDTFNGEWANFIRSSSLLVSDGLLTQSLYAVYNSSIAYPVDSPFWEGKTVPQDHPDAGKKLIPGIPLGWLTGAPSTPMPQPYIDNPAPDYAPDLPASDSPWEGSGTITDPFPNVGTLPDIAIDGLTGALQAIWGSIIGALQAIYNGITAIPAALSGIHSAITAFFAIPANPAVNINMDPLKNLPLLTKFPFCIPFDLIAAMSSLADSGNAPPSWTLSWMNVEFDMDFSIFNPVAQIVRYFTGLSFTLALILKTRELVKG